MINIQGQPPSQREKHTAQHLYFFFLPLPPLPFFPPDFLRSRSRLALRPRHIFCSIVAALWSVACCACTRACSSACTTQRATDGLSRKWSCDRAGRGGGGGPGRKAGDWGARLLALDSELRFPLDHELVEVVLQPCQLLEGEATHAGEAEGQPRSWAQRNRRNPGPQQVGASGRGAALTSPRDRSTHVHSICISIART